MAQQDPIGNYLYYDRDGFIAVDYHEDGIRIYNCKEKEERVLALTKEQFGTLLSLLRMRGYLGGEAPLNPDVEAIEQSTREEVGWYTAEDEAMKNDKAQPVYHNDTPKPVRCLDCDRVLPADTYGALYYCACGKVGVQSGGTRQRILGEDWVFLENPAAPKYRHGDRNFPILYEGRDVLIYQNLSGEIFLENRREASGQCTLRISDTHEGFRITASNSEFVPYAVNGAPAFFIKKRR